MNTQQDFYNMYRSRYYQRFYNHMGAIPDLPAEYGNANDRYHLLTWLHRAFKHLLDDFVELELEFEQFKNDLLETIEVLIPEIIREYTESKEFKEKIEMIIKEWFEKNVEERLKAIEKYIRELGDRIYKLENIVKDLQDQIDDLQDQIDDILKTIEGILGGGYTYLAEGRHFEVQFHNGFYTEKGEIGVGIIELKDRYIVFIHSNSTEKTVLKNDNLDENFHLLHGEDINTTPKAKILSLKFIGDYADLNGNSELLSDNGGSGIWNIEPVLSRASWEIKYDMRRNLVDGYPFTIVGTSYADGYNLQFSIYNESLQLTAGGLKYNTTMKKA